MLKCGFYEKEITPPLGCDMPGYPLHKIAESVRDRLYAKAISLNLGDETVIMIVVDICSINDNMYNAVITRVSKYTGVDEKNIMISATHTHFGPPRNGGIGEFETEDKEYSNVMERLVADTAVLAWQNMVPVTAKHNRSIEEGLGFNRNYIMKDGSIRTNPGWQNPDVLKAFGPTDPEFTTIFFYNEEEKPIGAIMNFACHHDSVSQTWGMQYSSDYSGVIAANMKKEFGSDFVNVFMSGACGNINHIDIFREKQQYDHPRYLDIGAQLSKAAIEQFKTAMPMNTDVLASEKDILPICKRDEYPQELIDEAYKLYEEIPIEQVKNIDNFNTDTKIYKRSKALAYINISKIPDPVPLFVQTIRIGDCMIFALIGEPYTEYGLELKKESPAKVNIVATICNGSPVGYIPVAEAYNTTIYEAQSSSAFLEADGGNKIVEHSLKQAEKLMNIK